MQKLKTGKISIFNSFDIKLEFLMSWVKLTQFSVELNRVKLKIWATWLESSWKCEQLNSILIWVQNINLKLNLMISLVKCEEHENHLYFQERKYVFNSDKLRLCIIQLTHDNVIDDHSERAKSYELISWVYWWSNIYNYVQHFVWNYYICTCFKLFKQWT